MAALLLAACASTVAPRPDDVLAGRLSIRVAASAEQPARSVAAGFELAGDADAGRLDLTSPIGSVLARARWSPAGVVLLGASGGETSYPDLGALTRQLLGEELPVGALFDWLRGRPWPGAPSTPLDAADGPGFTQLGWRVALARRAEGVVTALRDAPPAVRVEVRLDRGEDGAAP